jgi:hypothetical protein
MSVGAPQVIVFELFRAWSFEGMNIAALRVHAGHDVLNHTIFAGGVHALEDDQQRPTILRVELFLQVAEEAGAVGDNFFSVVFVLYAAGVFRIVIL